MTRTSSHACRSLHVVLSLLWVLDAAGCDEPSPASPECRAGEIRGCASSSPCAAERTCEGSPAHWGDCICPDAEAPTPQSDAGAARPRLGAACDDDAACPTAAFCLTPEARVLFGGSSPVGLCVADCSHGAAACDNFAEALCVQTRAPAEPGDEDAGVDADASASTPAARALCFARCSIGSTREKCRSVPHVACEPAPDAATPEVGYCRPICTVDRDCPDGHCDLSRASCVDALAPPPPLAFGARCDVGQLGACQGLCVDLNRQAPICSQRCVFGSADECAPGDMKGRQGACVLTTPAGSIGDTGYCAPLCDCPEDCPNATDLCDPFMDDVLERTLGRPGVCTAPELALHEPLVCE